MFDPLLLLISLFFMGLGLLASYRLKSKFAAYSKRNLLNGLSGKQVAEKMLRQYGITDVRIESVSGQLSDHYNPLTKTVNLSTEVYNGTNIAAAAVAAHECGHAVQHHLAYPWLSMRSKLVPAVQISSQILSYLTFGLAFLAYGSPHLGNTLLLVFIVLQSIITAFSLITLPVEIDASKRALAWLEDSRLTQSYEQAEAKDALKWAAYTYVISALASVATLLYYIWRFTQNNRD